MGYLTCKHCGAVTFDNPFLPRYPMKGAIYDLIKKNPGMFGADHIVARLDRTGDMTSNNVRLHICGMRRLLKDHGLGIKSCSSPAGGAGYRLVEL